MRKLLTMAMTAALAAAVIGVVEAGAAACVDGVGFRYCGEHVPSSRLPLRFKLNNAGRPSAVSAGGVSAAARAAAETWNRAWPKVVATNDGIRVESGSCRPLCVEGSTAATPGGFSDGVNTIGWGDPAACDGSHAERVAVACLWYSDEARTKIKEVDVILNRDRAWKIAGGGDVVLGEVEGSFPAHSSGLLAKALGPAAWFDVEAVLTHELGHALGLEDIGNPNRVWPGDLLDAPKHAQTMYRWYVPGSTNKRTLAEGDIAGLSYVAWDSAGDA